MLSTATSDQILAELTTIFRAVLDDDSVVLTPATTAGDIPDWDSMSHIAIIVEAERHFGIKVGTAEVETLRNVGDLVALVAARRAA